MASSSPRRAELLRESGWEFKVVPSSAAEIHHEELTARELAHINAYRKARAVAKRFPDRLVLGADTLVFLDDLLFGKPRSLVEAYEMLERLQGRTHHVVTSICLMHLRERWQRQTSEITEVTFRPLDAVTIRKYLHQVNPLDKAGAYGIQEHGDWIIKGVTGSFTNVVGLPMEAVQAHLRDWARAYAPGEAA